MLWFSKKGFWVFIPRYRGTWESGGEFLKVSPHQDVIDVMDGIQSGFTDLWNHAKYQVLNPSFYLVGSSFGGPAAILASKDKRVRKVVALSPVVDWKAQGNKDIDNYYRFSKEALGNAYRFSAEKMDKLKTSKFYNPMSEVKKLDGKKLMIIHAKDDKVVSYKPSEKFASVTGSKLIILKSGGHLSTSDLPKFWKRITNFI